MTTFTEDELQKLREHFGKIDRIDPCSEHWLIMQEYARKIANPRAEQLSGANIKWLSDIVKQELSRRTGQ